MRLIPAIDIINGKCVRLTQGDYSSVKEYNSDPLDVALNYQDHGIQYLHLVDLDGAKAKKIINHKVLEKIASKTSLKIDFGGGIQSDEDLKVAFNSGANQITGGSIAVKNPELFGSWLETYGAEKIILGADAKDKRIAISGWEEDSKIDIFEFIGKYQTQGIKYVISTDVAKDGLLQGTSEDLYKEILDTVPNLFLIASGGVSNLQDLDNLQKLGLHGVIIGKAIYENRISLKELQKYMGN